MTADKKGQPPKLKQFSKIELDPAARADVAPNGPDADQTKTELAGEFHTPQHALAITETTEEFSSGPTLRLIIDLRPFESSRRTNSIVFDAVYKSLITPHSLQPAALLLTRKQYEA